MNPLTLENKARIVDKSPLVAFQYLYQAPDFPFVFVSEGCVDLLGYDSDEMAKFSDIINPDDFQNLMLRKEATLAIGAPLEASFQIITKKGEKKLVLCHNRVSETDSMGMPYIIEGFLTDITKQVSIEAQSMANRASSDFWDKMGFEVRTSMNAILGLAELGLKADLPDIIRNYTTTIKSQGQNLMAVLNGIMDYKKIESGDMEISKSEYAFSVLLEDVISDIKENIGNLDFHVFVDSNIPNILIGDTNRIRQILHALLSNAIKFTDRGYVYLTIQGEIVKNLANLVITVEDTGRGIKEEDMESLFVPYIQFDAKTSDGLGLGLPIANHLVEQMGGEIRAVSGFGVGSVFTVALPQEIPVDAKSLCTVAHPERKRILLLNSKQGINIGSATRTIKNLGIDYTTSASILEFYDAAYSGEFTHIFADEVFYDEIIAIDPSVYEKLKLILVADEDRGIDFDGMVLAKPLWCRPVAQILNDARPSGQNGSEFAGFATPGLRALVVDDVDVNLVVASGFLKPYGMEIDHCRSGAEAIEAAKDKAANQKAYDLILMDHIMPGITGAQAARLIREIPGYTDTPIIAITATINSISAQLLRQSGINDVLTKPIDASRLNEIINKWLPDEKKLPGLRESQGLQTHSVFLKHYYESGRTLAANLRHCAEEIDLKNYRIFAHAIGGVAEGIGAKEVADAARDLERAARRGDKDFLSANNAQFLEKLDALLDSISPAIPDEEPAPEIPENTPDKKKILIIDDTSAYLMVLDEILGTDYDILSSLDGEDGLAIAKSAMPDLIMLDLIMPGLSGYDVLEAIRNDDALKHIPVIPMSSNRPDYEEKLAALGALDFLKKPFKFEVVIETINNIF